MSHVDMESSKHLTQTLIKNKHNLFDDQYTKIRKDLYLHSSVTAELAERLRAPLNLRKVTTRKTRNFNGRICKTNYEQRIFNNRELEIVARKNDRSLEIDEKNRYELVEITDRGGKLDVAHAELKAHNEPRIDVAFRRRNQINSAVVDKCVLVNNVSLGVIPETVSSNVNNVANGKCISPLNVVRPVNLDIVRYNAGKEDDKGVDVGDMHRYQRTYPCRGQPTRHWAKNGDKNDTLEERTTFAYRNGKWVHEAKPTAHTSHRQVTRLNPGQFYMHGSTSDLHRLPAYGPKYKESDHQTAAKSTSLNEYQTTEQDHRSADERPSRSLKPQHGLLDYAKKKWSNFAELVKDQVKVTNPHQSQEQSSNEQSPEIPPKNYKFDQEVQSRRTKQHSPLFGKSQLPRRHDSAEDKPPDVPPRNPPRERPATATHKPSTVYPSPPKYDHPRQYQSSSSSYETSPTNQHSPSHQLFRSPSSYQPPLPPKPSNRPPTYSKPFYKMTSSYRNSNIKSSAAELAYDGPTRPSRPKRDACKTRSDDNSNESSHTESNQDEKKIDKAYVTDALNKFDKILQSFQSSDARKKDGVYHTITEVDNHTVAGNDKRSTSPIYPHKHKNNRNNFTDSQVRDSTPIKSDDTERKSDIVSNSKVKPLSHRLQEYNKKIAENNCVTATNHKNRDRTKTNQKTHVASYWDKQTDKGDVMNIQRSIDKAEVAYDKFNNFENTKVQPRANNNGNDNALRDRPTTLPSNDTLAISNSRTVGDGPSQTTFVNNSFDIVDYNDTNKYTANQAKKYDRDRINVRDFELADPIAGNISAMNVRPRTHDGDDDVELQIQEDGDYSTPTREFVNVRRHSGYRSRKIRSIGPAGEYKETTDSSSSKTQTKHLERMNEKGKIEVFKERQAQAQRKTESVMGNSNGVEHTSMRQLDQAAAERQVLCSDGYRMSVSQHQSASGRLVDESAVVGADSVQVTRTVKEADAVMERHCHSTNGDNGMALDQVVITIPKSGLSGNKAEPAFPQQSPSGSDTSSASSARLGSRYRVVSNSNYASSVTTETVDVPLSPNHTVSETDRAVLLAAIEGRLREKEAKLFNPNAINDEINNTSPMAPGTQLSETICKTKLPSREEEESLARTRIQAQARAGMGGRVNLRKRNLIVDEEMMEVLFLRCIICQDRYDTTERMPKLLPCHHTYCLHCLKEMFRVEAEHRQSLTSAFQEMPKFVSINCPTCRENHMINDSNYSQLKSDQKVIELLEISTVPTQDRVGYCKKHRTQGLDFFCETCACSVCSDCRVLDHNDQDDHVVYDRITALNMYSSDVESASGKADMEDKILEEIESRLQSTLNSVESRLSDTVHEIKVIFENFKSNINTRQELLLNQLKSEMDKKAESYTTDMDAISQRLDSLVKTRACVVQAKEDEDVEQMFVNQKTGSNMLSDPFDIISDPSSTLKANFSYEKRDRANVMSTISDHGVLMFQS